MIGRPVTLPRGGTFQARFGSRGGSLRGPDDSVRGPWRGHGPPSPGRWFQPSQKIPEEDGRFQGFMWYRLQGFPRWPHPEEKSLDGGHQVGFMVLTLQLAPDRLGGVRSMRSIWRGRDFWRTVAAGTAPLKPAPRARCQGSARQAVPLSPGPRGTPLECFLAPGAVDRITSLAGWCFSRLPLLSFLFFVFYHYHLFFFVSSFLCFLCFSSPSWGRWPPFSPTHLGSWRGG